MADPHGCETEIPPAGGMDAPSVAFAVELIVPIWDEMLPLMSDHWDELGYAPDRKLLPDVERYRTLEDGGMFVMVTARKDGELVGYLGYVLSEHIHLRDTWQAHELGLYVKPEHRGVRFCNGLITAAERELSGRGIEFVYQASSAKHNIGPILTRAGYEISDITYVKRLD